MAGPADDKPPAHRPGTPARAPTPTALDGQKKSPSMRPGGAKALIGLTISDRYRIERLLGEGGMGAVYQAEHTHMRKRMAIKVLHPEMTRLPEVVARFEREAMAAAHIDHPNVVTATDFGKLEDGSFFLALEFVEGKSLREVIAQGPLELGRALHVARQIASALQRAHVLKIVHRDLKPENVMLVDRDGDADFVKVLDFGIAKVQIGELTAGEVSQAAGPGQPVLTQAGMVYGTPEYMAPEQALGQPVDARADLYALGIIMYEMLVGERPFNAESKVALLGMQVTAPVPRMAEKNPAANVPPEVEALVARCLAKEATERLSDAKELIEGISNILVSLAAAGRVDARYAPSPTSGRMTNPGLISGISPAPDLSTGQQPVPPQPSMRPPLLAGKAWLVALVAGTLGFLVLFVTIILVLKGRSDPKDGADGQAIVSGDDAQTVPPLDPSTDEKVKDGIASIERGDYGSGIEKLEALGTEVQARDDVQRALLTAYSKTNRSKEAIRSAGLILKANPGMNLEDKKQEPIRIAIRDVALKEGDEGAKAAVDEAFGLMENEMGQRGWDDLYDIAYGNASSFKKAAARAQRDLAKGDRGKMSPALSVTIDLQTAGQSCSAKQHFERASSDGDARTVLVLRKLESAHLIKQSGFKKIDLLACLHDGSIPKTIAAIEERLRSRRKP
jgi:serine/threonine-protein kinase